MSRWTASWHVTPDGITSIVELEIKVECHVETAKATEQTEAIVVELLSRFTELPQEKIRDAVDSQKWMGAIDRPDEPTRGRG